MQNPSFNSSQPTLTQHFEASTDQSIENSIKHNGIQGNFKALQNKDKYKAETLSNLITKRMSSVTDDVKGSYSESKDLNCEVTLMLNG